SRNLEPTAKGAELKSQNLSFHFLQVTSLPVLAPPPPPLLLLLLLLQLFPSPSFSLSLLHLLLASSSSSPSSPSHFLPLFLSPFPPSSSLIPFCQILHPHRSSSQTSSLSVSLS